MCLTVTGKSKILQAKRDIHVFKRLEKSRLSINGLFSPYRGVKWTIGETKVVKHFTNAKSTPFKTSEKRMRTKRFRNGCMPPEVHVGLHSYGDLSKIPDYFRNEIYTATIPKGTLYIRGADGEVVSLALRLDGEKVKF